MSISQIANWIWILRQKTITTIQSDSTSVISGWANSLWYVEFIFLINKIFCVEYNSGIVNNH